jgi:hypothetical protein
MGERQALTLWLARQFDVIGRVDGDVLRPNRKPEDLTDDVVGLDDAGRGQADL